MVNILANLAYHKREITVFGGSQLRPNIHIDDMVDVYLLLIGADPYKINKEIFNAGYENQSVMHLAKSARSIIGDDVKIKEVPTNDIRSYHISSDKINNKLNFTAKRTISDAISDLKNAFEKKLLLNTLDDERYFNLKKMQSIKLK